MTGKNNLFNIIDKFNECSVLVLGDIILDEYIWGKANRLSPEAPVPVLEVCRYSYILGGAANVANNIKALGGNVFLAGVIGQDSNADRLNEILSEKNIDNSCLITDKDRPTTVKSRLLAHNRQQLARFDRESKSSINESVENEVFEKISKAVQNADLILLSDYSKGVLTPGLISKVIKLAKKNGKPVMVDPKGLDFTKYSGATMITPNRLEAEIATNSPSETAPEVLAAKLRSQLEVEAVLVTLGEDGLLMDYKGSIKTVPAVTSEVYDVTGAGDSLISGVSLGLLASGSDFDVAIELGNYAAGVAVRKIGTTAVTPKELKNIIELHKMENTVSI